MRLKLNPFFTQASGKLDPSHDSENMVYTLNNKTFSRKVCNPRDLKKKPYSSNEQNVRAWFIQAQAQVRTILSDPTQADEQLALFKANPGKYHSLRTWLFAKEYARLKNG